MRMLRWLFWPLLILIALAVMYVIVALVLYRDIPVEQLEAKYGGDDLRVVEVQDIPFRYRVTGPLDGSRPILLLIHSHYWTMRMWDTWIDVLKDDFTLVRYDMTSHGLTGPDPSGDYSARRGAELLHQMMRDIGIQKATLVGSSTGAAVAYMFAREYPEQVDHLVLMNAPGMPKMKNKYVEKGMPSWMGYVFYVLPTAVFKPFLQFAVVDKTLITDSVVQEFHEMYRRDGNRWAEYLRMSTWEPNDMENILAPINVPVLIQWGAENPQLSVEDAEHFKRLLKNSPEVKVEIYEGAGHVLPIEKPRETAHAAREFIRAQITKAQSKAQAENRL